VPKYVLPYIPSRNKSASRSTSLATFSPITDFVETGMLDIPEVVEQIPIVPIHSDMGLHNIIVSSVKPTQIMAIIDWEFCASVPYVCVDTIVERLFRKWSPNDFGEEYPQADELRSAFWDAIPEWASRSESAATKIS
jgi:Ser/Thr protein kinase RdoA (MazF antagonist)